MRLWEKPSIHTTKVRSIKQIYLIVTYFRIYVSNPVISLSTKATDLLAESLGKTKRPVNHIEEQEDQGERDEEDPVDVIQLESVPEVPLGRPVHLEVALKNKSPGLVVKGGDS